MTDWATFVALTGVVLVVVLLLSRLSQGYVTDGSTPEASPPDTPEKPPIGPVEPPHSDDADGDVDGDAGVRTEIDHGHPEIGPVPESGSGPEGASPAAPDRGTELSTTALLANVTLSQGSFAAVLVGGAWYAAIPASALGLTGTTPSVLAAGAGLGLALYVVNEVGAGMADRIGIGHDERLRESLAPDSVGGWILLLGVVLPVIAGFEELLFRAALIGVVPAGYGVSQWVMVGLSSVAFGAGHGAQGKAGIAVTTALGAVLGAAFVVTGSLMAVVLAHYLVNALEFLVHEAIGVEWRPDADAA